MRIVFLSLLAGVLGAATAHAEPIWYFVSIDTGILGNLNGEFQFEAQLNDGSASQLGNNQLLLSNFDFGGGSAGSATSTVNGASGSMAGAVTLSDLEPFNVFRQSFTPGRALTFILRFTNLPNDPGPDMDLLQIALLRDDSYLRTGDPFGASLLIDQVGVDPMQAFAGVGDLEGGLAAQFSEAPEPRIEWLAAGGLLGLMAFRHKSRARVIRPLARRRT